MDSTTLCVIEPCQPLNSCDKSYLKRLPVDERSWMPINDSWHYTPCQLFDFSIPAKIYCYIAKVLTSEPFKQPRMAINRRVAKVLPMTYSDP